MPARKAPAAAVPSTGLRPDVRAEVRRTHIVVLFFYLVDGLLLTLFGAIGSVPLALGLCFALAGCAATALLFWWFKRRGALTDDLEALGLGTTVSAGLLMLVTLGHAPQVGGLMLMSMMAVLALSAVQLRRRHQLSLCVLMAAGSIVTLAVTGGRAGIPTANVAEQVLSAAWVTWLMVKASAHNITGTRLREQVKTAHAELAQALRTLEDVASTDDLTLLPNRRAIMARVQRAVTAERQRGAPVGIALLDIDHFKRINDRHGHEVGDQVLRDFGRVVARGLRPTDQMGRYGGEEFLLLLQAFDDSAAAAEVVDRLCEGIASHDWTRIAPGLSVTASAGVTLLMPGEDCAAAIRRADAALYEAKNRGRNRVVAAAVPLEAASGLAQLQADAPH